MLEGFVAFEFIFLINFRNWFIFRKEFLSVYRSNFKETKNMKNLGPKTGQFCFMYLGQKGTAFAFKYLEGNLVNCTRPNSTSDKLQMSYEFLN